MGSGKRDGVFGDRARHWAAVVLAVMGVVVLLERFELRRSKERPLLEKVGGVCGADGREYADETEAEVNGSQVLHTGLCGKCSNANDLRIYWGTSETLTTTTSKCALAYFVLGRQAALYCMDSSVPFTSPCRDCWVDNIKCTTAQCSSVCLKHVLGSLLRGRPISAPNSDGSLNDCLSCDERMCGPEFKDCAGATRRRSGIRSDINRDLDELAHRCYICDLASVMRFPGAGSIDGP